MRNQYDGPAASVQGKRKARIGIIQVTADWDIDAGLEPAQSVRRSQDEMLDLAEECLKEGADLVLMPEAYQYRRAQADIAPIELARIFSSTYKERLSRLAAKYSSYVVPWDYEYEDNTGRVYNTSYILDRKGTEIGRYRKVQITEGEEKAGISRGCGFPVFDLDFAKVGIMICFDNYYPESARILGLKGAELILYPLYGDTLKEQWETKLKARAIDNSLYIASCHIGTSPVNTLITFTGMTDPAGNFIYKLENQHSYGIIEIQPGKRVITCTSACKGRYEDLKQYLLKERNEAAYGDILMKAHAPDWDEIQYKSLPPEDGSYLCLVSDKRK